MNNMTDLIISHDNQSGKTNSVSLYGIELLDQAAPCTSELMVNGAPLTMRPHTDPNSPLSAGIATGGECTRLKGEHYVDHFTGWGLVLVRHEGARRGMRHKCVGIQTLVRREICDLTCPCPGPGGPVVEAPLYVDTFSVLNWNWNFWGADTRMIFPSAHSSGPADEYGHAGYEHDTPEECKRWLQNSWRRTYPGGMLIHGGVFYNAQTGHWIAITCRKPHVGYCLNINNAGRGVSYDFTLHAPFGLNETLQLPEVTIYYGRTRDEMMSWMAHYITFYYQEAPDWVYKTVFISGINQECERPATWQEQGNAWIDKLEKDKQYSGIGYCLVTARPVHSDTTPIGYAPDPNHGTIEEFKAMCHHLADRGIPLLIWLSHTGLLYRSGPDIDDDWFIRGIDGRVCASWGGIDSGNITHVNPGHPGYIEYTKKWIRFYIKECRCKGIFMDCLSWVFPTDFSPRSFMRYPGDTNRMAIHFMNEIYACVKECDPEAILLGEGASLDGPVNVFSVHTNPRRAVDSMGPRDFLLQLNNWSPKRMIIDQGPTLFPAGGYCRMEDRPEFAEHNRFLVKLMRAEGGRDAFQALVGDLSVHKDLLFVPVATGENNALTSHDIQLPGDYHKTTTLTELFRKKTYNKESDGYFRKVLPGIYRMQ